MRPAGARRPAAFAVVGYVVVTMLAGSNLPTPLYPAYQRAFGLSPLLITLVYATYALTVMPCLLLFGPLSDAYGRRRVLIGAVSLGIVSTGLFAAARGTGWLVAAQIAEGVAMGALQAAAVAALVETHPRADKGHASLVGSSLTVAGAALGPILAGGLAQLAPWPRRLPYLLEMVLLGAGLAALVTVFPHDHERARTWRPRRPSVPRPVRRTFVLAGVSAFLAWAIASLFLSLVPSYVIELLSDFNLALVGALAALMLACSAVAQLLGRRAGTLPSQVGGLALAAVATLALIVAAHVRHLGPLVVAAALAGVGLGAAFRGSLSEVNAIAPEDRRGDIVASFYLVIYAGTALPVIGVGALALEAGLLGAVQIFAAVSGVACLVALGVLAADRHRPRRLEAARS